jgi:hypothetical protein
MRIHKISVHMETLYIVLCPKERKLRVLNEAQFSDLLGGTGYPTTFRASPRSPTFFTLIDIYSDSEI